MSFKVEIEVLLTHGYMILYRMGANFKLNQLFIFIVYPYQKKKIDIPKKLTSIRLPCSRVRTDYYGGAWCPKNQITTEPREWIEIDLHIVHVITAAGVQGRFGNGQGAEFTEAYLIDYWRPKLGKWVRYKDFKGNEVRGMGLSSTYFSSNARDCPGSQIKP